MSIGKLYKSNDEKFVANVHYKLFDKSPTRLWGELRPDEYIKIDDGGGYVIELEDTNKCQCYLTKRVNGVASGLSPRYIHHFTGNTSISPSPPMTES